MELSTNGNISYCNNVFSFDEFVQYMSDFDNCRIDLYPYLGEIDFYHGKKFGTLYYKRINDDDPKSEYVKKLIELAKKYQKYKASKEMFAAALKRGKIPEDIEKKEDLVEFTNKKIDEKKAECREYIKEEIKKLALVNAVGAVGGASVLWGTGGANLTSYIISSIIPTACLITSAYAVLSDKEYLKELKGQIKDYNELIDKIKGTDTGNPVLDEISKNEFKDKIKVKKYNDRFINEVAKVIALIKQLPYSEREEFRYPVDRILDEYQGRVKEILAAKSNITFGRARDVYALYTELMPLLIKIELKVLSRLNNISQYNDICDEVQDAKLFLHSDEEEHLRKVA